MFTATNRSIRREIIPSFTQSTTNAKFVFRDTVKMNVI